MHRVAFVSLSVLLGGCFAPDPELTDQMPDDLPQGQCGDTDTDACETSSTSGSDSSGDGSTSTGPVSDACEESEACLGDDACVAEWDSEREERGPFACRFACVPVLDETAWCSDDASCCDADAVCTPRGYCVLAEASGTSTGGGE